MLLGPHLLLHTVAELQERVVVLVAFRDVRTASSTALINPLKNRLQMPLTAWIMA